MQSTLQEHILHLELKIQSLSDKLTNPHLIPSELERIRSEIRVAELALAHYRKAYELENAVNDPPAGENGEEGQARHRTHGRRVRRNPRTNIRQIPVRKLPLYGASHASLVPPVNQIKQSNMRQSSARPRL